MVFSGGVLAQSAAQERFDVMLRNADEIPFAKQPIIERSTGQIIGYSGVAWFEFDAQRRLEFGWRLTPKTRGLGYATEAGAALLAEVGGYIDEIHRVQVSRRNAAGAAQ